MAAAELAQLVVKEVVAVVARPTHVVEVSQCCRRDGLERDTVASERGEAGGACVGDHDGDVSTTHSTSQWSKINLSRPAGLYISCTNINHQPLIYASI